MDSNSSERDVVRAVARIHARILAMVFAVLGGAGLFLMTIWLVLKGGVEVGPHLGLLSQYFYGYSVTWGGSLIGLVYGGVSGAIIGWAVGWIYNFVADARAPR